ncbi:MAG: hypothetical protein ISR48_03115 [Alphaproteobacteria bacterium]|nr:hypothetical protein [Alphaproteobacteria bacterium]
MPKTDVKKIESEDLKELTDEALDRTAEGAQACQGGCADCICWSPAE